MTLALTLTKKHFIGYGMKDNETKDTWINADDFLNKPVGMPRLTVQQYRENGWRVPAAIHTKEGWFECERILRMQAKLKKAKRKKNNDTTRKISKHGSNL